MNLQPDQQHREEPEVSMTALIDVVFLLLIFFMVSTTFDRFSQLHVDLPKASADAEQTVDPDTIEIIIDASGRFFIGQNELFDATSQTLRNELAKAAGQRRDQVITIRADARTPHQAVVTAMDAAGRLGFTKLRIATVRAAENQ
ncbi:MAG: biopolymer transporter ExbD [Gammaproteobacteria bacterium]|nr:MAG: biopolymer transporter ExbD [Gammaproteobacteria bacterium]